MSTLAPIALMLAHLAEMTDEQFRAFVDGLRHELAPANFMEKFLVERISLCINRMRRSARAEAEGQAPDAKWLRYEAAAERGFWNAYKELMKNRRPKARPATKADAPAPVAVAPVPAPTDAPIVAPPRPAVAPAPKAAPPAAAIPPNPEPRRRADRTATSEADRLRWRAECLALMAAQEPAGSSTFLPISVGTLAAAPAANPEAEAMTVGS